MRILVFAIPEFGNIFLETILRAKKNVVALVLPPVNHPAYLATKIAAQNFKIPEINIGNNLKNPKLVREIKKYNPDVALIAAYPKLIPKEIYSIPPLGTINCHPSLLPQYRGANPYFHVIRNGESQTGITFHYLDNSFDTGDIISQWIIRLLPDETLGTLYLRLSFKSSELYLDIIDKLERGEDLPRIPQPKAVDNLHVAKEINFNSPELLINWTESASSIEALVRASNPFFGALTSFRQMPVKIWTGYCAEQGLIKHHHPPGTIIKVTASEMAIATASGIYYPTCLQLGMLYTCDINDFIKRNNPKVGETLN